MDDTDKKILEAYTESILREKKFDLGSGTMGNGVVIWNRAKEVHGDYENVAHIDQNRKIKYYIKNPPKEVITYVENIAKGKNFSASASQSHMKVFKEGALDESSFIDDSKVADAIFKELEIAANDMIMKKIIPEMKKVETNIQKKYKTTADSTMYVKNLGSAFIHDVLRQLLGQSLLSVSGSLKRIKRA
jgi:hypothetical protein